MAAHAQSPCITRSHGDGSAEDELKFCGSRSSNEFHVFSVKFPLLRGGAATATSPLIFGVVSHLKEFSNIRMTRQTVNAWCGMMKDNVIGFFLFQETTVKSHLLLGMLEHYTVPQLPCEPTG
jgi:hypothetical protein